MTDQERITEQRSRVKYVSIEHDQSNIDTDMYNIIISVVSKYSSRSNVIIVDTLPNCQHIVKSMLEVGYVLMTNSL
jgi:hypothetical protein